jgi:hypothetical protein
MVFFVETVPIQGESLSRKVVLSSTIFIINPLFVLPPCKTLSERNKCYLLVIETVGGVEKVENSKR